MLVKATLLALIGAGAATVSAAKVHAVRSLISRQLDSSQIPSSCQSTCSDTVTIYNACISSNATGCLSVCETGTFNGVVDCFSCVLENSPGVNAGTYAQIQADVSELESVCASAGETVTPTSLVPFESLSNTAADIATATGIIVSITADEGFTFTSASSGITIGAVQPSTGVPTASATSAASSTSTAASVNAADASTSTATSSAATTAATSSAATSSSTTASLGSARPAALPLSFAGTALGVVGAVVGAALVF